MINIFNAPFHEIEPMGTITWIDDVFLPILSFYYDNDPHALAHVINVYGEYVFVMIYNGVYSSVPVIPATVFKAMKNLPLPENGVF
jgi:hypothetical protein